MDRKLLPPTPTGIIWRRTAGGLLSLVGLHNLPNGTRIEKDHHTRSVPVARRRYIAFARLVALSWASGTLDLVVKPRKTRKDKGKPRAVSHA